MTNMDKLNSYLTNALEKFDNDPADSEYQRGYQAALVETLKTLLEIEKGAKDDVG